MILFLGVLLLASCVAVRYPDYYWRDFAGYIPEDAVPAGKNLQGIVTYVGQALHQLPVNGKLIPGVVDVDEGTLVYNWNDKAYVVENNYKILCSAHGNDLEWVLTDNTAVKFINSRKLVLGGYDTSYPLYIGRIHAEGQIAIGKVTVAEPYDAMCFTLYGIKASCVKTEYQILTLRNL